MKLHLQFSVPDDVEVVLLPKLIETKRASQPDAWQLNPAATRPDPSLQTLIPYTEPETEGDA